MVSQHYNATHLEVKGVDGEELVGAALVSADVALQHAHIAGQRARQEGTHVRQIGRHVGKRRLFYISW